MNTPKILVIDDEEGIRNGCKRALAPQGFEVLIAENGDEGLNQIRMGGVDLVLLDVMMPGISGIDLIGSIHQTDPDIVCIIITGYATVELAVRAIKQGAYDFLTKPFNTDDLMLAVNQGLERRKLSLEAQRLQSIEAEARQLTEEKTRLEELDRAKVAFIHLVTHELKAPVAAIQNYLQLILEGYIEQGQVPETLRRAETRAQELLALISDLLEFGRLREVKALKKTLPVKLDEVLKQTLADLAEQLTQKQVRLTTQIEPNIAEIQAVPDEIKSVWTNLVGNALKYTPTGGGITVKLSCEAGMITGSVTDSGIGIPAEALPRLFTEFYRADNAKKLNIPGTGLGLAIVKNILVGLGGEIEAASEKGQGAAFTFRIPISR